MVLFWRVIGGCGYVRRVSDGRMREPDAMLALRGTMIQQSGSGCSGGRVAAPCFRSVKRVTAMSTVVPMVALSRPAADCTSTVRNRYPATPD